ncbi:hypothetical protein EVAR_103325_1 [Eumeta japonica]|uniref:Uncharacterized protein n=1 Tax=Eumeta variegata TaxID=151549 RepID=A0A4C1Z8L4_EUMVA|nr:hypothetical protein EVAR_103325_1 [Eumeta japonica]
MLGHFCRAAFSNRKTTLEMRGGGRARGGGRPCPASGRGPPRPAAPCKAIVPRTPAAGAPPVTASARRLGNRGRPRFVELVQNG